MTSVGVPVVSVILPAFNVEGYVGHAIARLLEQSYRHVEVVVVDDKSEDATVTEVLRYADDPRVVFVQLPANRGVANARNVALEVASGDFVWFVDADDEWSGDFIKIMLDVALRDAADVVVCSAVHRFGHGLLNEEFVARYRSHQPQLVGEDALEILLLGTGALWNKLFKRAAVTERPFPPLRSKSDHGGLLALLPTLLRVSIVPDALYTYLQRDGSISNGGIAQPRNFLALLPIAEKSLGQFPQTRRIRQLSAQFRCDIVARALRESWRFTPKSDASTRMFARDLRWTEIAVSAARPRAFLTCAAAKVAPVQSRSLFRWLGRNRWSAQGLVHD